MIKDRPDILLNNPIYCNRPSLPYKLNWDTVPELVRVSILDLGGIQPVTGAMISAAGGTIEDRPSDGELALFRSAGTKFQLISVVASVVAVGESKDKATPTEVTPFSLSLIPASKRGDVEFASIDKVGALGGGEKWADSEFCYVGYDPFVGDWDLFGASSLLGSTDGFLDEFGLVIATYFLATDFDSDDVLMMRTAMPTEQLEARYRRKRCDLLFRPFERLEARRIWGADSPIELFVVQELALRGLHPQLQILIMDNGKVFPAWYHFWQDLGSKELPGLVTEADLYFPDQKLAVFCDGAHHQRLKQRKKDALIDANLLELGITSVRLPGRMIVRDLASAVGLIMDALDQ